MNPRLRKTLKWTGLTLSLALLILWLASAWYVFIYKTSGGTAISLASGQFGISHTSSGLLQPGIEFRENDDPFDWWFTWVSLKKLWFLLIPMWAPLLPTALTAALLWHKDNHATRRANHCPACNYNRAGVISTAPCPECGSIHGTGAE